MEGNNGRDIGYYRIERGKKRDPEADRRALQKGYGIEHPERINGYSGLFFGTGDVLISEAVVQSMSIDRFREFVLDSLQLFRKEKYGGISSADEELNGESRWLGNGDRVFGRYGYFYDDRSQGKKQYDEMIRIRMWKGNIWITFDSELDLFLLLKDNGEDPGIVKDVVLRGKYGTA